MVLVVLLVVVVVVVVVVVFVVEMVVEVLFAIVELLLVLVLLVVLLLPILFVAAPIVLISPHSLVVDTEVALVQERRRGVVVLVLQERMLVRQCGRLDSCFLQVLWWLLTMVLLMALLLYHPWWLRVKNRYSWHVTPPCKSRKCFLQKILLV